MPAPEGRRTSTELSKPSLRGVLHQFGAPLAAGAGLVLVQVAPAGRPRAAVSIYALSLVVLFAVSATYHRVDWSPPGRMWMRRADHACIFLLIAGTYTPIAMLGLPPDVGNGLLIAIWSGALLGVLQALFWVGAPRWVTAALAVAVGWTLVPYMSAVRQAYGDATFAMIILGGVAYTIGAVAYALKRPALWPTTFGYHEVFHFLTIIGAGLHLEAVLTIVQAIARGG